MAMVGAQRSGGGVMPPQVMVEIASDPERFDRRIAGDQAAKDAANAAQAAAQEAKGELPATREALAKAEAELAFLPDRDGVRAARRHTPRGAQAEGCRFKSGARFGLCALFIAPGLERLRHRL
jgi:hypothetical protein